MGTNHPEVRQGDHDGIPLLAREGEATDNPAFISGIEHFVNMDLPGRGDLEALLTERVAERLCQLRGNR
jgi:hypothetical protein